MFGVYDVRGIYGKDVTESKFAVLGTALSRVSDEMVLGMDYREHNQTLVDALLSGFSGKVSYAGFAPTPLIAFNSGKLGVAITASHNPPQYSGAKFIKQQRCFFSEELAELEKTFKSSKAGGKPRALPKQNEELVSCYLDALPDMSPKAIFDLAGGSACAIKNCFGQTIFSKPDPRFEKHTGEPTKDALSMLAQKTREKKCLGLAFDGDADRVAVVDCGEFVDGEAVGAFLTLNNFKRKDKIILSIDISDEIFTFLRDNGFVPIYSPVGDVFLMKKAFAASAAFAFERSSHYSFFKHMPYADGIYSGAILSHCKPGEILEFSKQFKSMTLFENIPTEKPGVLLPRELFSQAPVRFQVFDGLKARYDDFSILIRASQTEPKIRINVEAKTGELRRKGMILAKEELAKNTKL